MARSHISDFLQVGRFHVLDVSFSIPPVLIPVFGFRSATLPTMNMDVANIKEGNYEFPRKVIKGATTGPVTLEQGVSITNSDFYDWCRKAVVGRMGPRNLLVVQFSRINPVGAGPGVLRTEGSGFFAQAFGNLEFAARIPGRAWMLENCRPLSYKPGTDFDAMAMDVSIQSLELEVEEFTEYNLGV